MSDQKVLEKLLSSMIDKGTTYNEIDNMIKEIKESRQSSVIKEIASKLTRNVVPVEGNEIKVGEKYWYIHRNFFNPPKKGFIYMKIRIVKRDLKKSIYDDTLYPYFGYEILPYEEQYDDLYGNETKIVDEISLYGNNKITVPIINSPYSLYPGENYLSHITQESRFVQLYHINPVLPSNLLEEITHQPGRGIVYQDALQNWNQSIKMQKE